RKPAQTRFAEQREMNAEGERAKSGIGADVRCRLVAADMLFSGGKRKHIAAPSCNIDGLAAQAPRRLAQEFFARREKADIGAAEVEGVAKRLALADNDVGAHGARRLDESERDNLS